jgi:hypothetical protein
VAFLLTEHSHLREYIVFTTSVSHFSLFTIHNSLLNTHHSPFTFRYMCRHPATQRPPNNQKLIISNQTAI